MNAVVETKLFFLAQRNCSVTETFSVRSVPPTEQETPMGMRSSGGENTNCLTISLGRTVTLVCAVTIGLQLAHFGRAFERILIHFRRSLQFRLIILRPQRLTTTLW